MVMVTGAFSGLGIVPSRSREGPEGAERAVACEAPHAGLPLSPVRAERARKHDFAEFSTEIPVFSDFEQIEVSYA